MKIAIVAIAGWIAATAPGLAQTQSQADRLEEIAQFFAGADIVSGPSVVDCTLSGGTKTTCFQLTVTTDPQTYTPGPWCPSNISQDASHGGIWLEDGEVHDVDGAFIANLAEFYGDTDWQLFDAQTGDINFTGTLASCEAAARPDVDAAYNNYCVQCLPEYMPDDASVTYVIPLDPQPAARASQTGMSGSGIAYNGIRLDGPAPVDAILDAHTIAPFDDCGGHVNLHVGYHYHAVTTCLDASPATTGPVSADAAAEHGMQIGLAMDGYQIFSHLMGDGSDPADLDACNGHQADNASYHYHAGEAGSNAILACLMAEAGCVSEDADAACDASARPGRP
ncbi:YHYH protein [Devosia sp. BSSL-BM10]|uniref:YHYH protein n=1 Tax=Devosia litorisediminis TaxID=2829817 RepID=A0A942E4W1_9HYPH|nr:YHYH protein [Devosia litorisediminis]MBS3847562.1 YHYH protein [Devosia litorisediminis]